MKNLILLFVAVVLVGCGVARQSVQKGEVNGNKVNLAKLSLGMTKSQVLEIMGLAGKIEAYQTKTGGSMEFLIYRTVFTNKNDRDTSDKYWTPICLIDGKVVGWGRNFYDDTIKIRKEIIKN